MKFDKLDEIDFQDFVDCWENDPDCGLAKWSRSVGHVPMKKGVDRFYKLARKSPEHARWVHYHIGWLFSDDIRNDLIGFVSKDPVQSYLLYCEDYTLSEAQIEVLERSFLDKQNGCLEYISSCENKRNLLAPRTLVNEGSEIVSSLQERGKLWQLLV